MTIDEAIAHAEEVAENYRYERDDTADINDVGTASDCQQCANDHEQLASWLQELKEAKRLLKAAIEDYPDLTDMWRYADEALKLIGEDEE